jgi:hypothetical protein
LKTLRKAAYTSSLRLHTLVAKAAYTSSLRPDTLEAGDGLRRHLFHHGKASVRRSEFQRRYTQFTCFTCFTCTKVRSVKTHFSIIGLLPFVGSEFQRRYTQFTCFTSTQVRILTAEALKCSLPRAKRQQQYFVLLY